MTPGRRREPPLLATALPFAIFALLVLASWNRWLEPYVDSGRELMVPWRVSEGQRLYASVAFHHGPLGPFLGAASDRVFGRSLGARTALAAAVTLLQLLALVRLTRRMLPPWRAALACSLAVAAAFFLRPGGWLFPFSFDAALAVAAVTGALAFALDGTGTRRSDAVAGICLAAALLARIEIGLAAVAAIACALRSEGPRLRRLAVWPLGAAGLGYAAVSFGIPLGELIEDGWLRVLDPPEAFRNVYRAYAGLDRPVLRLTELLLSAIVLVLAAALLGVAAVGSSRAAAKSKTAAVAVEAGAILVLAVAAFLSVRPPASFRETASLFPPLVRIVPPVVVVAAAWRLVARLSGRTPGLFAAVPDAALWIAGVFAARLLLAAGYVGPYDAFFLPLPLIVGVAGAFAFADRMTTHLGSAAPRLAAGALAVFLVCRVAAMADLYRRPGWSPVATPAGTVVLPEPVAATTRLVLADLSGRMTEGRTLAGFPEAGFFNYVLGRPNPFRHEQYFPGHLEGPSAGRFAAEFSARPPDVTLFTNVLAVGEGARIFGKDYLESLDGVVRSRTRAVTVHGPGAKEGARIGDPDFFVEVRVPSPEGAP